MAEVNSVVALHVLLMEALLGAEHPIFRFSCLSGGELSVEALGVTLIREAGAKQALVLEVEQVKEHAPLGKPDRL